MEVSEKNNLIVGEGVRVNAAVEVPGEVHVEGTICGEVVGQHIKIGTTGRIEGCLEADHIEISGYAGEKVHARKTLVLRSTAHVIGEVQYEALQIEAGAKIQAKLQCSTKLPEKNEKPIENKQISTGEEEKNT
ncbi:Polymer-forming protein [Ectothiorhodosinus mongolicus]|uniref:Polymer-forming protein n=1 Tax=Ectothiorhodosinus mongolicus TaxID=233100 RepID=A0A1R3VM01_9GAMM|nr:polymer-forming cytoskeletal protein [Ectothiorhodosinus mongolicus]ULX57747.1 hypothetical protein CKX93_08850 [Ectothiorhodosinus mongolicus]SIT65609.1 Polymer-forming protein [Ectothiorhodosinus mongolicus]